MKKYFLLGLSALLALGSCKTDFDVAAPYKDITVVYGILNQLDTAHYIRIQKAFLDEHKSAIDMSKVPDSSFYKDLVVTMKEYSTSNILLSETPMTMVDLNTEGYQKDDPANVQGFFTSPSYGYKLKKALSPYVKYRLIMNNKASGKIDSSDFVGVVNSDTAHAGNNNNGNNFYIADFAKSGLAIDFAKHSLATHVYQLRGNTPANGNLLEGKIRFHYVDSNVVTGTGTRKFVDIYMPSKDGSYSPGKTFTLEIQNSAIYAFLRDAMGLPPANTDRYLTTCEIWVYCGSTELTQYKNITLSQSGGLTGDQIKPTYTNMKGKDVLGLLASKTYRYYDRAAVTDLTIDSMAQDPITQPLNIKGRIK